MKTVAYSTEKGVSVKVRDAIRKQVNEKYVKVMQASFAEIVENVNGGYAVPVAIDQKTGNTIYANFTFTISDKDPSIKAEPKAPKKSASKPKVEVVLENLFD